MNYTAFLSVLVLINAGQVSLSTNYECKKPDVKYHIDKSYDEFDKVELTALYFNYAFTEYDCRMENVSIEPWVSRTGKLGTLALALHYHGKDWIFIREKGKQLAFLIDGKEFDLLAHKARPSVVDRGTDNDMFDNHVRESIVFSVKPEEIMHIARGKNVKVKIYGDRGSIIVVLSEQNKANLIRFIREEWLKKEQSYTAF
jgi:hypothetical protein